MEKTNISVLGCCVSRDVLEVMRENYDIVRHSAFSSPYTILSGNVIDLPIEMLKDCGLSGFASRCISLDACKGIIKYIGEEKSDWLLIDIANSRNPIIQFNENKILTGFFSVIKILPQIDKYVGESSYKIINVWELPYEVLEERLLNALDNILKLYKPQQIILNEFYCAFEYISKRGLLKSFKNIALRANDVPLINPILKKLYVKAKEKLEGCHIIKSIDNVLGDENNKWGLDDLHFCKEYYEYAERSLSVICNSTSRIQEEVELKHLHELYTEKFNYIREHALHNTTRVDRERLRSYSIFFETLINKNMVLYSDNNIRNLVETLLSLGYNNIALYGNNELTKELMLLIKASSVQVCYVVENASKPISGIKTINRNSADYPDCDVMLVADIAAWPDIKAKLEKMKVPFPFFNAAEFIQSLPAGDGTGLEKIKKKISDLSAQLTDSDKKEESLQVKINQAEKDNIDLKKILAKTQEENSALVENVTEVKKDNDWLKGHISEMDENIRRLNDERGKLTEERDLANEDVQSIKNSASYKLGRAITFIPRKVRDLFKPKNK